MKKLILIACLIMITACEYVPLTTYEIKTIAGETIKLSCPVVEAGRSKLTYLTDSDGCRVYK